MEDPVALIDQLIKEHKVMNERVETIDKVANDASLLGDLEAARDTFVPGRFDQRQSLEKLEEMVVNIAEWVNAHFNREETSLRTIVERREEAKVVAALDSLLAQHNDLRARLGHAGKHVAELMGSAMARHQWEASANDMRAHIHHTRTMLEDHASTENKLFAQLRRHLGKAKP